MKIFTLLAAFTIATSAAHAQAEPEYLKTKSLSFNFNGLNLSGPNGGVGGKIWISDQRALTLGLNGAVSSRTVKAPDSSEIDDEYSRTRFGLVLGMEQHVDLGSGFSPYVVGGISAGFDRDDRRYGTPPSPYENESSSTYLGVQAGVGIEYWLTRRVSLAGQQLITGTYSFGSARSGAPDAPESDIRGLELGLGTSSLILSLYL